MLKDLFQDLALHLSRIKAVLEGENGHQPSKSNSPSRQIRPKQILLWFLSENQEPYSPRVVHSHPERLLLFGGLVPVHPNHRVRDQVAQGRFSL